MYYCQVKVEVCDRIASGLSPSLQGTTYLQTPLFGMISVVTLFVKGAEAVHRPHCDTAN